MDIVIPTLIMIIVFTDLVKSVANAISMIKLKKVIPAKFHDEIKEMYSWVNVAERTEKVWHELSMLILVNGVFNKCTKQKMVGFL